MMVNACKCGRLLLNECTCIHSMPNAIRCFYFVDVNNNNTEGVVYEKMDLQRFVGQIKLFM